MANKPNKKPNNQATPQPPQAAKPAPKPAAKPVSKVPVTRPPGEQPTFSTRTLWIILGIVSIVVYINTVMNGFVMDDVMVLKENNMVLQGMKAIPELLSTPHMRGYLIIPNDLYRPLSLVMFAIEYQLFGLAPAAHHFFNVLWFAGCTIMFFIFLDKFFDHRRTAVAFIAALIFAVHPVHTEVVANIKSRDELMCFFFAFWSLNLFMSYMKEGKMLQLLLGTLSLYLSYISKETVIAFLGIIPVLFFFYNNSDKKRAFFILGGTALATIVFLTIRSSVLNAYDANQPFATVEFIDNALAKAPTVLSLLATKVVVMGIYLKLMFIPYPLLSTYSFNSIPFADLTSISFWLSLIANGALIYFMVTRFMKNKKDPWAFAIMFYFGTIFLFSNFPFLMGAELAERFAFFASAGTCLLMALAIEKWIIKKEGADFIAVKSSKVLAILIPLCLLYGGWAIARNTEWKDNVTLYKADIARSPNDVRLYHNVASALAEDLYPTLKDTAQKIETDKESLKYLREGSKIYPEYADLYVEMGRIYDRQKVYDSAMKYNKIALDLNPTNFTANNNLGSIYLTAGRYQESIPLFRKAMELNPNFKYAYLNIARAYVQLKKYDSAVTNFNKLLSFEPQNADVHSEAGTAYFMMAQYDSAEYHYKMVLKIKPDEPNTINNLGAILLNTKKYPQAIEIFKKSIAANPNYFNAYSNLTKAYYFTGQYQAAIDNINKEISLDQKNAIKDIPYIALCYQKMGNMAEAKKWEATAKQYYSNFKLE